MSYPLPDPQISQTSQSASPRSLRRYPSAPSTSAHEQQLQLAEQLKRRLTCFGHELVENWSISLHHTALLHQHLAEGCMQAEEGGERALERLIERQLKPLILRELGKRVAQQALPLAIFLSGDAREGFTVDYVEDAQRLAEIRLALATQLLAQLAARLLEQDSGLRRSAAFWAVANSR